MENVPITALKRARNNASGNLISKIVEFSKPSTKTRFYFDTTSICYGRAITNRWTFDIQTGRTIRTKLLTIELLS